MGWRVAVVVGVGWVDAAVAVGGAGDGVGDGRGTDAVGTAFGSALVAVGEDVGVGAGVGPHPATVTTASVAAMRRNKRLLRWDMRDLPGNCPHT